MRMLAAPFDGGQLTLIIILAAVFAFLLVANACLAFVLYYKRKKKKLCTQELQQRREDLLGELQQLGKLAAQTPAPVAVAAEPVAEERVEAIQPVAEVLPAEEEEEEFVSERPSAFMSQILAVSNMTEEMRTRFALVGEEYDEKRYFVRMSHSFEARLRSSNRDVKTRYTKLVNEALNYKKINVRRSFRRERIYCGRKTLAVLLFRGKTLCIAFALDPAEYADTKYRGEDMSAKKSFASTPMLLRLTSQRRLNYAKELLAILAQSENLALKGEFDEQKFELSAKTRGELFNANLIKIALLGEAPPETDEDEESGATFGAKKILPVNEMSALMRERFGLEGELHDGESYYATFSYGFEAKLRASKQQVKDRYKAVAAAVAGYKKLKIKAAFRQQRITFGRKTLGILLFKGKTLCVALALDPAEYEETKYRGENMSETKRFAATPMLLRLTSERRTGYAAELINKLAAMNEVQLNEGQADGVYDMKQMSRSELYAAGLLKIKLYGKVDDVPSTEVAATSPAQE